MRNVDELFGVYVARVVDVKDPENLGRLKVRTSLEGGADAWARIAMLFAGDGRGGWFVPEIDAEVVVAFEAGDPRRPIVIGSLWKAGDRPPESVRVADSHGNSVTFEASGVTVTAAAKVTVQASQVAISAGLVTVEAGMAKFSGVVQADTVITNSVVSASYTPGAGNIW
jgi:phage baseplate assembly protein gpV